MVDESRIEVIRNRYEDEICADEEFWEKQKQALYASIFELQKVKLIEPVFVRKSDRRGWVSFEDNQGGLSL